MRRWYLRWRVRRRLRRLCRPLTGRYACGWYLYQRVQVAARVADEFRRQWDAEQRERGR